MYLRERTHLKRRKQMSITEKVLDLHLSENVKLVQVYGQDNKFCTVIDGDTLYLMKSTIISKYNIVASFDIQGHYVIYDRDKANVFVDWSHEHYNKAGNIEELPEHQIGAYLVSYLENDINELIKFDQYELTGNFERILKGFTEIEQAKLFKALEDMKVYKNGKFIVPYAQMHSASQMTWADDKLLHFMKLDCDRHFYDACTRTTDGGYKVVAKNHGVGNYNKLAANSVSRCYIAFNKTDAISTSNVNIEQKVLEDIEGSSYAAANQFINLECKFEKSLEELTSIVANKKGYVNLDNIHHPDVEKIAESIARRINAYKRAKDDIVKRQELLKGLIEDYTAAYAELQKAQDSLRELHSLVEA